MMSGAANPRGRGVVIVLLATLALLAAACGGSSATKTVLRPTTNARLIVVSPAPNSVVGSSVRLVFRVDGGRVVGATSAAVRGDEGHIHVSVDGRIVSMAYGLSQTVSGLTPGTHTLSAEFVATDHVPFANRSRVLQRFVITVKG